MEQAETTSTSEQASTESETAQGTTPDVAEAIEVSQGLLADGLNFVESLLRAWSAYQIAIALGLFLVAHLVTNLIRPQFQNWVRAKEGWPKWRLRWFVVVNQRLRAIIYVILIWVVVLIMREMTWPSRSYLLSIIANLATAWLIVAFASRLIKNTFLRRIVSYGAWVWITLRILNLTSEAETILDSAAVDIGTTRISLWLILQAIVLLSALFFAARFISTTSARSIQKNEDISPSMRVLFIKFLQLVLYGAAFFIGLKSIGIDLTGLAVLSGAIGVGLGFGLQKVVSNLVSGIIILLDKSIKPGDVISLGDTFGWINSLGARYVSVVTRNGKEYLIPNEDLITGQVVNWSFSNDFVRLDINFGTAYHDDPHKVRKIAIEAAKGCDRVISVKSPVCHIIGFGDSSVDYVLRFWIEDPTGGLTNIRGNVYLALWDAFQENDISIPFPQREIKMLGE